MQPFVPTVTVHIVAELFLKYPVLHSATIGTPVVQSPPVMSTLIHQSTENQLDVYYCDALATLVVLVDPSIACFDLARDFQLGHSC